MNQTPTTEPRIIFIVVLSLFFIVLAGFVGTWYLIHEKIDGSLIAVFSGLTGTALGMLGSILNNTRTTPVSGQEQDPPKVP